LSITAQVKEMRTSSLVMVQDITRNHQLLVRARVVLVCISGNFRPRRIPEELRHKLQGCLEFESM
ncbi:MAG TPA: tol-pal system-associated acyl-CoA thioesterase, partial [bacterium]|nr:tol-pal system-associated acyl-CoA thioesterase [bacterium]